MPVTRVLRRWSINALVATLPIVGPVGVSPTSSGTDPSTLTSTTPALPTTPVPSSTAFSGTGMWIWELSHTDGGDIASIIFQAKEYGINTLFVKSSDGSSPWGQFSSTLVSALHENGLRACAWQYVYGAHPLTEAAVGSAAVNTGADCLVIDAESEYQGRYVQAQQYVTKLRKLIGNSYPVGLAGLPYIDYHPGFPYSIFLGPGGAQFNLPQMYWKDIGTSVDNVYAHTYRFNSIFGRPIFPLGQLTSSPSASDITRFRQLSVGYGAGGISWWDWQESAANEWTTLSAPLATPTAFTPSTTVAQIKRGSKGDLVVWAQEHLVTAGDKVAVDGDFGPATQASVQSFQTAHGLSPTGIVDSLTWAQLLRYKPAFVHWWLHVPPKPKPKTKPKPKKKSSKKAPRAKAASDTPPVIDAQVPRSASLPQVRNELAGKKR